MVGARDNLDLKVGDQLPHFERNGTLEHWNRFAAVNCEFAPHHWDDGVANDEGFDRPFAMAPLQMAFFNSLLRDWLGENGRVVAVTAKLRGPFFKDTRLTTKATVSEIEEMEEGTYVLLDIAQVDDSDRSVATGTARVLFETKVFMASVN
tara:strand:+ start:129 stop:578 length:450 start_codon:yes stop_codon:yes gene_type:complete